MVALCFRCSTNENPFYERRPRSQIQIAINNDILEGFVGIQREPKEVSKISMETSLLKIGLHWTGTARHVTIDITMGTPSPTCATI